jgi:hypothetical protein
LDQTEAQVAMTWERVFTVNDYYDGPRRGVADFRGKPHVYESQFSDAEAEYTDRFLLMEIESELFQLVLEDWAIWLRWHAAYQRGDVSDNTHPALPEDRKRHEELKQLVGSRLCAEPSKSVAMGAKFRSVTKGWDSFEVQWREVGT